MEPRLNCNILVLVSPLDVRRWDGCVVVMGVVIFVVAVLVGVIVITTVK